VIIARSLAIRSFGQADAAQEILKTRVDPERIVAGMDLQRYQLVGVLRVGFSSQPRA
jgi:hypothetical protein